MFYRNGQFIAYNHTSKSNKVFVANDPRELIKSCMSSFPFILNVPVITPLALSNNHRVEKDKSQICQLHCLIQSQGGERQVTDMPTTLSDTITGWGKTSHWFANYTVWYNHRMGKDSHWFANYTVWYNHRVGKDKSLISQLHCLIQSQGGERQVTD